MTVESKSDSFSRREFLRTFPLNLVKGIQKAASGSLSALNPSKDLDQDSKESAGLKVARIDITKCHAWGDLPCQLCYLARPKRDRAIEMRDQKPVILLEGCDGCAMCEAACKTVNDLPAIQMVSRTLPSSS
jgi:ferredoxin-type protein NapG